MSLKNPIALVFALVIGWVLSLGAQSEPARIHHYQVKLDPELTLAEVEICFSGKPSEYLIVDYGKSLKHLRDFPYTDGGHIEFEGRYWKTANLDDDACIRYSSDISAHLVGAKLYGSRVDLGDSTPRLSFQSYNSWLWLPEQLAEDERLIIDFELPKNFKISAPWEVQSGYPQRFLVGRNPHDWGITLVIGEFDLLPVTLKSGGQINVALVGLQQQKQAVAQWLESIANSLAGYMGRYPFSQTQIIAVENRRFASGPVPWGEVNRGGNLALLFVVDSDKPIETFYQDWTASHEFAHLLVPKIDYRDSWLSEGLASYLQYLLMARAGQISQEKAWQKLYSGLLRGEAGTKQVGHESLLETVENRGKGRRQGRTMRIYWSGAAYFLLADWQLRTQTDLTLAEVLARFNRCCMQTPTKWRGADFATKLDELSNSAIFSKLYQEIAHSNKFPEFRQVFSSLGLKIKGERLVLDEQAGSPLWRQMSSE